jgi:hypothetical protein
MRSDVDVQTEVPICCFEDHDGWHQLSAEVEELTLTYRVIARGPDGGVTRLPCPSTFFTTLL